MILMRYYRVLLELMTAYELLNLYLGSNRFFLDEIPYSLNFSDSYSKLSGPLCCRVDADLKSVLSIEYIVSRRDP